MGRNVFVSYKYADSNVRQFRNRRKPTTARNYVDVIATNLKRTGEFYYWGEKDGEDLSGLHYKVIEGKLADKRFSTSVTIVLVSKGMFNHVEEIEQWIPWEISYSLKNKVRAGGNSYTNAILAIVLPDRNGSYNYAMYSDGYNTFVKERAFFKIMSANMFNRKGVEYYEDRYGNPMYRHGESYIVLCRWSEFCSDPEDYIGLALENRGNWEQFNIVKKIDRDWRS